MAEPTITLAYSDFSEEVGRYLGYGRTSGSWSSDQQDDVDVCVNGGYRAFLYPPPIPPETESHQWSFMTPTDTVTTAAADSAYDMDDDFGGLDGVVGTYSAESGYWPVTVISESQLRTMLAGADTSGRPVYCAIRPKAFDADVGQRFEMLLYPEPDAEYVITFRKIVMPAKLSSGDPYPLGGPRHGETIMSSILAFAEKRFNDEAGIHTQDFITKLAASISLDRTINAPHVLGYNGDRSDRNIFSRGDLVATVTYNSVEYEG